MADRRRKASRQYEAAELARRLAGNTIAAEPGAVTAPYNDGKTERLPPPPTPTAEIEADLADVRVMRPWVVRATVAIAVCGLAVTLFVLFR